FGGRWIRGSGVARHLVAEGSGAAGWQDVWRQRDQGQRGGTTFSGRGIRGSGVARHLAVEGSGAAGRHDVWWQRDQGQRGGT
ncbi:hypothetical protein LSAT2_009665, partial [Lamellibrachia satsuma]